MNELLKHPVHRFCVINRILLSLRVAVGAPHCNVLRNGGSSWLRPSAPRSPLHTQKRTKAVHVHLRHRMCPQTDLGDLVSWWSRSDRCHAQIPSGPSWSRPRSISGDSYCLQGYSECFRTCTWAVESKSFVLDFECFGDLFESPKETGQEIRCRMCLCSS